jgi:hypothetical protein
MGAVTRILSDRARVVSRSRTGRHWVEEIDIRPGDLIAVIDITNSGKHNCYFVSLSDAREIHISPALDDEGRCLICEQCPDLLSQYAQA